MTITAVNTYMKFDTSPETAIHIPVVTNIIGPVLRHRRSARSGVCKVRPAGQMRPARRSGAAREMI